MNVLTMEDEFVQNIYAYVFRRNIELSVVVVGGTYGFNLSVSVWVICGYVHV